MSLPVPTGRIDLLLLALCEEAVKKHLEPRLGEPLWDAGLNKVAAEFLKSRKVPTQPVSGFQLAGVTIPLEAVTLLGRLCLRRLNAGA